jgi:hypothetical protein
MVKFHELLLVFDTNKPNEQIEKQALELLDVINVLLAKHLKETLPQICIDLKKKPKISLVLYSPDDIKDE